MTKKPVTKLASIPPKTREVEYAIQTKKAMLGCVISRHGTGEKSSVPRALLAKGREQVEQFSNLHAFNKSTQMVKIQNCFDRAREVKHAHRVHRVQAGRGKISNLIRP